MNSHLESLDNFKTNIKKLEFAVANSYDVFIYLNGQYNPHNIAHIVKGCDDMSSYMQIRDLRTPFNKYLLYCVINGNRRRDFVKMLKSFYDKYNMIDHFEIDDNYVKVVIK